MRISADAERSTGPSLEDVYRTERKRLQRLAYLMTGQRQVAEDLVHDAFVRVHDQLPDVERPAAYMRTTVTNLCLAWRGRAALARERTPRPERDWVDPPEIDETWDLLSQLPAEQRVALVLRYYADLPHEEIAEAMGCRVATARTRIHRALKTLKKEMAA